MRKSFLLLVFLAVMPVLNAQETSRTLVEGDIVTLGAPQGSDYRHIDFPRRNFIIKRGAIANFKALIGTKLVVERTKMNKDGLMEAVLRRKDGLNFFKFFPSVTADVGKALKNREICR